MSFWINLGFLGMVLSGVLAYLELPKVLEGKRKPYALLAWLGLMIVLNIFVPGTPRA